MNRENFTHLGLLPISVVGEHDGYECPIYFRPKSDLREKLQRKFYLETSLDIMLLIGGEIYNYGGTYGRISSSKVIRYRFFYYNALTQSLVNIPARVGEDESIKQVATVLGNKQNTYYLAGEAYVRNTYVHN